jgi:hypothetical protein
MPNVFNAHIFKQQQLGDREEVRIKIFGPDGEPLDLSSLGGGSDPDPGGSTSGAMIFKGTWNPALNYKTNEVVVYDDGDGMKTYIFTQDHNAGLPAYTDVNGNPITKFWDPASSRVDLVLGADSYVGGGALAPGRYDVFVIKVNAAGLLSLRADDILGQSQDLGAVLWHLKQDGTWETVVQDDDGSGQGKPWIRYNIPGTHALPGIYAYYLSRYSSGITEAAAAGTTKITPGGDNTAVIGSFADFPLAKAVALGMGEAVSAV